MIRTSTLPRCNEIRSSHDATGVMVCVCLCVFLCVDVSCRCCRRWLVVVFGPSFVGSFFSSKRFSDQSVTLCALGLLGFFWLSLRMRKLAEAITHTEAENQTHTYTP